MSFPATGPRVVNQRSQLNFAAHQRLAIAKMLNVSSSSSIVVAPIHFYEGAREVKVKPQHQKIIKRKPFHLAVKLPPPLKVYSFASGKPVAPKAREIREAAELRTFRSLAAYADKQPLLPQTGASTVDPQPITEDTLLFDDKAEAGTLLSPELLRPRDGETGLFFTREDVVDTLMNQAMISGWFSPFWISEESRALKEKLITLLPNAKPTHWSAVSLVFPASRLKLAEKQMEAMFAPKYLNPKTRVPGMNVLTGLPNANPVFSAKKVFPSNEGWVSMDQILMLDLKLTAGKKKRTPKQTAKDCYSAIAEGGLFVELAKGSVYNQMQLTHPGKLFQIRPEEKAPKVFATSAQL